MSIFFDFEVSPSGRRFRRAVDDDKKNIEDLMTGNSKKLFGAVDIGMLIELTTLSICMINEENDVLGFMSLRDAPNVPGLDPGDWEVWIRNMFQRYYMARNTLFIHFMCCHESVNKFFFDEALVTIFDHDAYLTQIVLVVPPGNPEDVLTNPSTKKNFYKYYAKKMDDIDRSSNCLYTFLRQDFCPILKMRRAVEGDNDDIVKILDKKCTRLRDMYGDYYISEIIGRHKDSTRTIIVAEHQDRVVGVMCLNSEVNYENLEAKYNLHSFHGFKKATPLEKEEAKRKNVLLSEFGEPIMSGKWSPFQRVVKIRHASTDDSLSKQNAPTSPRAKKMSKVNFGQKHDARKSTDRVIYFGRQIASLEPDDYSDKVMLDSPGVSRGTSYSFVIADLLEEEPFEYEIVNIDNELLAIPDVLSLECPSEASEMWRERKLSLMKQRNILRKSKPMHKEPMKSETVSHKGGPSAFIIELVGFQDNFHDRHAFDLLKAALEIMKQFDYCLIRVPTNDKVFALLEHFCFIPTRMDVCCEYALYAAHRASILGRFRVRPAEIADVPQIATLLHSVAAQDTVWTIENSVLNKNQKHQAYVFLNAATVIGVAIIEPPEQTDFIRAKFNLDLYHNHKYHVQGQGIEAGFSTVKVALVYPAFEVHYRFFAKELMRFSGSCALLWLTAYRNKWVAHKANCIVSAMIPLIPRKSEIDCVSIPEHKKIEILAKKINAFSCWFLGKKMTTMPKVDINNRIVIVGASRTTLAFLDTLLFSDASTYLNFTNVTLISPYGLPYSRKAKKAAESMFPQYRTSANKFLKSVPYTYYVNVIQGTMVDINKGDKFITLANGSECHYDLLFLLLGTQYQHPNYLEEQQLQKEEEEAPPTPYVRINVLNLIDTEFDFKANLLPENVFVINNVTQANRALKYVGNFLWEEYDYTVIVYGSSIHAYCCLEALIEARVPPKNIIFMEPFPMENKSRVPVFCNVYVDKTVIEMLKSLKITVYRSYYFKSWTVDTYDMVKRIQFISYAKMISLECAAFFYYGKIGVSAEALNAIKKSGLVYDGGILIDHEFRTKDPYVYASGPATRFFKRYFADSYRLKYYDSYEVGEKLGSQIRNMLDPVFTTKKALKRTSVTFSVGMEETEKSTSTSSQSSCETSKSTINSNLTSNNSQDEKVEKLPVLKKPLVTHCFLPGGMQYLDVRPPGKKKPHYFIQTFEYNGIVMETYKGGYFKLHLDRDYIVDGITCISPQKRPFDNFKNLYGLSAVVLNNVHLRYTTRQIDNLFDFFKAKWALYLYHERANELFMMIKELFPLGQQKGETLQEALFVIGQMLSNPDYKYETKMHMRANIDKSLHMDAIAAYVMHWVHEFELPMYIQNETKAEMHRDLTSHGAFIKRKRSLFQFIRNLF